MSEPFSIKSTHSDRELVFSEYDGDYFLAELKGGINAVISVYSNTLHTHDLSHWFNELSTNSAPWENELSWESLEGEFKIFAKCTALSHIQFTVALSDMLGAPEEAHVQAGIETELGELTEISKAASKFFTK